MWSCSRSATAGSADRLGVEPQRGHRRTQPVGQVADRRPLGGAAGRRCVRPARSSASGELDRLGRAADVARADRSPSRSWCAVWATPRSGSLIRRPSCRAISPADRPISTSPSAMIPSQAAHTPALQVGVR